MPQVSVLFCRFPGGQSEHPDCTDWLVSTVVKAKNDSRISDVQNFRISDTPITMGRNRALEVAKSTHADYVLMIDSDMSPDMYLGKEPKAAPFWDIAFNFLWKHQGPAIIAAPYGGPPPHENVYVFRWANLQSEHPNPDMHIAQFTREDVAHREGIEEVAALPTGLILIDMRGITKLVPPYFYYEWKDETQSEKASTEDVTFTRDSSLSGVPQYCAWNCWAGHWKLKRVGRPQVLTSEHVREQYKNAVLRDQKLDKPNGQQILCATSQPSQEELALLRLKLGDKQADKLGLPTLERVGLPPLEGLIEES